MYTSIVTNIFIPTESNQSLLKSTLSILPDSFVFINVKIYYLSISGILNDLLDL